MEKEGIPNNSYDYNRGIMPSRKELIVSDKMKYSPKSWKEDIGLFGNCGASNMEIKVPKESILHEAHRLVHGDRGEDYGKPWIDLGRTARIVNAILSDKLKEDLTAKDVAKMMIAIKLSRETNKAKRDNRADIAGYAEVLDMIVEHEKETTNEETN
jgi:hypothetical protein